MEIKSTEFFKNLKSLPDIDSEEYDQLIKWELEKCMGGVNIGGIHIPGILYGHLNHWHIIGDGKDKWGNIIRIPKLPDLRDNEWERAEYYEKARIAQKGYLEVGLRQGGKSEWVASHIGMTSQIYQNGQNVLVAGNSADMKLLTEKIDFGMKHMWPGIAIPKLDKDWRRPTLRLGFKETNNEDHVWSYIMVRNAEEGKNTEAGAGTTAKSAVYDEIGKYPFSQVFEAHKPAFVSEWGWRCVPLLIGCVCEGTKVWGNNGDLINIEDLKQEQGILGYNGKTISKEVISYQQEPLQKECLKITTNTGRSLSCSIDHPILYRSRNETTQIKNVRTRNIYFKEANKLEVGNQIGIIEEINLFSDKEMWEPRLVGWLIGDGSYGFDKTPVLSNCDGEINNYITNNFNTKIEKSYLTKEGKEYRETRIKEICPKLRELGIYGQTKLKKTLPINIHSYSENSICELLGGFFDTDGTLGGHTKGIPSISLTASSEKLLLEVQLLLQKLGIHGGIKKVEPRIAPNRKDKNAYYRLSVCDRKSIQVFHQKIKFSLLYKQERLENIIVRIQDRKNCIPKNVEGLRFERIVSVEKIGIQDIYNLTAATTHTYIANGIVTHNTGGSFDKGADAERVFYHAEANNFQSVLDEESQQETGLFMSGLYRQDCKEWTDLYTYLTNKGQENLSDELKNIPIKVSNKELALKVITDERKQKAKDPDRTEYLKQIMYYPLTPTECFLSSSNNFYNGELARQQKLKIEENDIKPDYVELYFDGTKIVHKIIENRVPISTFPTKSTEDTDAPITIWEHPVPNPPYGLYVAGVDPYKFDEAKTSDSLGAVYIFKRMHDIHSESYQDCFVASYVARPKEKSKWNEQAKFLIGYYNAQALVENDENGFCEYMIAQGKGHLIEDQPGWLKEIIPNSVVDRGKGISRSSVKVIKELRSILKEYLEEKVTDIKGSNGEVVGQILGMSQVFDAMLCEEISKWNYDGNFDREVAASLAVTQARKMDKMRIKIDNIDEDNRMIPYSQRKKSSNKMFGGNKTSFKRSKSSLFRK